MLIFKQEKEGVSFKKSLEDFNRFKKDWKKEDKVYLTKLFNFSEFKKRKKDIFLALDFRNLNSFEIPVLEDLEKVDYIFINKNLFLHPAGKRTNLQPPREVEYLDFINKKIKLVYSFENFSFDFKREIREELRKLFKKEKDLNEQKYNKIISNIFLEIVVEKNDDEEIFKSIIFIRKILNEILEEKEVKKIKILLKNNFSQRENEELIKNKLFKISGVIITSF